MIGPNLTNILLGLSSYSNKSFWVHSRSKLLLTKHDTKKKVFPLVPTSRKHTTIWGHRSSRSSKADPRNIMRTLRWPSDRGQCVVSVCMVQDHRTLSTGMSWSNYTFCTCYPFRQCACSRSEVLWTIVVAGLTVQTHSGRWQVHSVDRTILVQLWIWKEEQKKDRKCVRINCPRNHYNPFSLTLNTWPNVSFKSVLPLHSYLRSEK